MKIRRVTDPELDAVWQGLVDDHLNPQRGGDWFGLFETGALVGVSHLVRLGGLDLFDDLWIRPERRRQGFGKALVRKMQEIRPELWLIADPPEVAYYEQSGFRVEPALPALLIERYTPLGLWPGHLDHLHVPMRWNRGR